MTSKQLKIKEKLEGLQEYFHKLPIRDEHWCRERVHRLISHPSGGIRAEKILKGLESRVYRGLKEIQARSDAVPAVSYPAELPIAKKVEEISRLLDQHQVIVLAGETGSGKSTQIPKICLQAGLGIRGLIGVTQPRRIAARSVAARVAEELGVELGQAVGYQVRFQERVQPSSHIKFMTDGILLAETHSDPELLAYDTLIIDEAHERSLNIDFLLGYIKSILPRRADLKVIITSATIDTEKFSRHFDAAPIIEVSGRSYPVSVLYRPLDDKDTDLNRSIEGALAELSRIDPRGDVLVFLPGERDIREALVHLQKKALKNTEVLPLFARLSTREQNRIFHPGRQRRVILSTNVAETSLTVPGIQFVIDSGLARISRYSSRAKVLRLPIEAISQASANQRAGRCGRLGPGTCIRLYSEEDFSDRPEFTEPEIVRTSLASVILRMKALDLGEIEGFPFVDSPSTAMINDAFQLLLELKAVDGNRTLTPIGRRLAQWPVDVRIGRMILEAGKQGCLREMLVLAAVLSIQDPRERPLEAQQAADEAHQRFQHPKSDFCALLSLWDYLREQRQALSNSQFRKRCQREFLAWRRVREWFDLHAQLRGLAKEQKLQSNSEAAGYAEIHQALLSGLISNVGRALEKGEYQGIRGRKFRIFPGSGLAGRSPKWLLAADLVETSRLYARGVAVLDAAWLLQQAAHILKYQYFDPHWSARRGRVVAWKQTSLFELILGGRRLSDYAKVAPAEAREIFIRDALVGDQLQPLGKTPVPDFVAHNRTLVAEVHVLEAKRRSRDVLVDEDTLCEFYRQRLPDRCVDVKTLAQCLAADPQLDAVLRYSRDLLFRSGADVAAEEQYPGQIQLAGQYVPLSYAFGSDAEFAEGDDEFSEADGVTAHIPLYLLNAIDERELSWLIPGWLQEKVMQMVKGLPKPLRRPLTPARQFADEFLRSAGSRREKTLSGALSDYVRSSRSIDIPASSWDGVELEPHLQIHLRLLDEDQKVIDQSQRLDALKRRWGGRASTRVNQAADFPLPIGTAWVFGEIPPSVHTKAGLEVIPALEDQGKTVALKLFQSRQEAAQQHLYGVAALCRLQLRDKVKYLKKQHGISTDALMCYSPVGTAQELVSDLLASTLTEICGRFPFVRTEQTFNQLLATVKNDWGPLCNQAAGQLNQILPLLARVRKGLKQLPGGCTEAGEDIREALDDLIYTGFLQDLDSGRLNHYPRYLAAMVTRLKQLSSDSAKDRQRQQQLEAFWRRYQEHLQQELPYDQPLDDYRWLLHEFRVSLFAQKLGTAGKVSAKRLQQCWEKVQKSL